jgi:drug/metabolite transporter (DMT)-like permease
MSSTRHATAAGLGAILLWSTLALLSRGAAGLPAWQLLALSFAVGTAATLLATVLRHGLRAGLARCAAPPAALALGVAALFGFHALYFHALKLAPPAQASLIVYLWPLLIALGAAWRERAAPLARLLSAALGLLAAALVITLQAGGDSPRNGLGYALAAACALVWAGYSLANRRFAQLPAETLIPACALTALGGLAAHLALESWTTPSPQEWAAVVALGLGPVGGAFLLWDLATKRGDLGLLGIAAYAAPVLSTLWLVLAGAAPAHPRLFAAAGLIVLAAVLGTRRTAPAST